jgi:hypothetical protein
MADAGDLLDQVVDFETFLRFVGALIDDRMDEVAKEERHPIDFDGRGANGWENHTIEAFLEAAHRWAQATRMGQTQGLPEEPSWKAFAVFLWCGKIYE